MFLGSGVGVFEVARVWGLGLTQCLSLDFCRGLASYSRSPEPLMRNPEPRSFQNSGLRFLGGFLR